MCFVCRIGVMVLSSGGRGPVIDIVVMFLSYIYGFYYFDFPFIKIIVGFDFNYYRGYCLSVSVGLIIIRRFYDCACVFSLERCC